MTSSDEHVQRIAEIAKRREWSVAAAESLTSGLIASRLGAGPDASTWFRGGIVAYAESVKFDVLGVDEGPVVSARCARQMAQGACRLLDAQAVVAVTGVGGPDPAEGKPAGTVFVSTAVLGEVQVLQLDLGGDPGAVLRATVEEGLRLLGDALSAADRAAGEPGPEG